MNRQTRAFTLIELLAVIAIIGILAAILIPVVGSVRDSAKNAKCVNNLRQFGTASLLFENDYGHLPWGIFPTSFNGGGWWADYLIPYIEGQDASKDRATSSYLHECPARLLTREGDGPTLTYSTNRTIFVVGSEDADRMDVPAVRSEQIERPTEVFLLGDATQRQGGDANSTFLSLPRTGNPRNADRPLDIGPDSEPASGTWPRYRHNGRANFVFVDGHVASIAKGKLLERNLFWHY